MTDARQYIVDSDESAFDRDVLQPSSRHLILVDFWAPWCGPCRSLAPILEKLMIAYSGAARLVREGELADALEHLMEIIQRDRNFREDEPRRIILRVFDLAGGKGELVSEYRKRLARALN